MAQHVTVTLEDDLDGGPADETLRFAFGGTHYEIDLNKKNAAAFRKQIAPFAEHARRQNSQPRRPHRAANRRHLADIRAWAKTRGYAVAERGRVPTWIVDEYGETGGTLPGPSGRVTVPRVQAAGDETAPETARAKNGRAARPGKVRA